MSRTLIIFIRETADELKHMMHAQQKAKLKERVHALYLLKNERAKTLQNLVDFLGRSKSTIESWLPLYRKKGLLGLLAWNYHGGQPPAIPEPILTELREKLNQPQGFKNYGEIQQWLKEEYGLEIHYKTVYQTVHYKLKAKLKVARPMDIKRDDTAVVEFKKKLPTQLELIDVFQEVEGEKRPVRSWSQDESRLGLHTITRRLLTLPGVKQVGPMQWQFEAFYLYGAVEPLTGESFFLEFSSLDTVCFQTFLKEFSKTYPNSLNILQVDNASFHLTKKLIIPDNVILLLQPAYSTDVNPIERVWQSVKDKLSGLAVGTLDELRREMEAVLNSLTAECIASLTGDDFILSSLKKAHLAA